ncbi:kinase domain protein, putative (macronuclear) [Tetrahymena thermophila SB210]|uniref:Kinase domain protein, putative n=1 Tax=Tetrahymena thermophila (strain SB210) TaxID=312017 RepID=I7LU30_TETTS|nr:kinase domain protein, putative [Tetrahymena thermophila SB210]EAR89312.2 kinase domain protein, putative [Tetrahymena thermophila SB210]|eukprot:XP_001009557.2 kinase domain protein, putative [Tetrahymena thermophila SB210]
MREDTKYSQEEKKDQESCATKNDQPEIIKTYTSVEQVILSKIRAQVKEQKATPGTKNKQATGVGKDKLPEELAPGEQITFCGCCARQIQKTNLPLNVDTIELAFLGSAYVAYLEYIKFAARLILTFFLTSGFFNLLTNSAFGVDCQSPAQLSKSNQQNMECVKNWVTEFSLGNKRSEKALMTSQSFFNLFSIIICIIQFQKFRYQIRLTEEECDEREINAADYSILVSDIPDEFTYEGDIENLNYEQLLKEYFSKNLAVQQKQNKKANQRDNNSNKDSNSNNSNIADVLKEQPKETEIVSVGLCFDLKKFKEIENNLNQLNQKLSRCKDEKQKAKLHHIIAEVAKQRDNFSKDYTTVGENRYKINNFTGYAYVILQYEDDQERITEFYEDVEYFASLITGKKSQKLQFQDKFLTIEPAPDPNNIFWLNLRHTQGELLVRRSALFFITLLLLGGCLGLLFSFQLIQMKVGAEANKDSVIVTILSFSISVSIIILNLSVQIGIQFIAEKEARPTKIGYYDSIVIKQAFGHFLNTSVLLFIIQVFIYQDGDGYGKLFKAGGLAYNMNSIFMTNMIVQNLVQGINIPFYVSKSIRKGFMKVGNTEHLQKLVGNQEQLNQYFENPIFNLYNNYSIVISSVFSSLFYAPVIPFALVWTFFQLVLKYWVDKHCIIKQSTLNVGPNINLCKEMIENLEYALPLYCLSNLIFFVYISKSNEYDSLSIFGIFIGVIHAILPMELLNERIYPIESSCSNTKSYEEMRLTFITDYDRENPIKKLAAIKKHYKDLKQKAKREKKLDVNCSEFQDSIDFSQTSSSPIIKNIQALKKEHVARPSIFGARYNQGEIQVSQAEKNYLQNLDQDENQKSLLEGKDEFQSQNGFGQDQDQIQCQQNQNNLFSNYCKNMNIAQDEENPNQLRNGATLENDTQQNYEKQIKKQTSLLSAEGQQQYQYIQEELRNKNNSGSSSRQLSRQSTTQVVNEQKKLKQDDYLQESQNIDLQKIQIDFENLNQKLRSKQNTESTNTEHLTNGYNEINKLDENFKLDESPQNQNNSKYLEMISSSKTSDLLQHFIQNSQKISQLNEIYNTSDNLSKNFDEVKTQQQESEMKSSSKKGLKSREKALSQQKKNSKMQDQYIKRKRDEENKQSLHLSELFFAEDIQFNRSVTPFSPSDINFNNSSKSYKLKQELFASNKQQQQIETFNFNSDTEVNGESIIYNQSIQNMNQQTARKSQYQHS